MKKTLLILAAGFGTRFGGVKQLISVGPAGERIIDYSIFDAVSCGYEKIVFVIRKEIEKEFINSLPRQIEEIAEIHFTFQKVDSIPDGLSAPLNRIKPWGTAHAVLQSSEVINEPFTVVNADDFYGANSFNISSSFIEDGIEENIHLLVGFQLSRTISKHGPVSRGICEIDENDFLISIKERKNIQSTGGNILAANDNGELYELQNESISSMNMFTFHPSIFSELENYFSRFYLKHRNDINAECHLPSAVKEIIDKNVAKVKVIMTDESWFGVTYKSDRILVQQKLKSLVENGVYPENLWNGND